MGKINPENLTTVEEVLDDLQRGTRKDIVTNVIDDEKEEEIHLMVEIISRHRKYITILAKELIELKKKPF